MRERQQQGSNSALWPEVPNQPCGDLQHLLNPRHLITGQHQVLACTGLPGMVRGNLIPEMRGDSQTGELT